MLEVYIGSLCCFLIVGGQTRAPHHKETLHLGRSAPLEACGPADPRHTEVV